MNRKAFEGYSKQAAGCIGYTILVHQNHSLQDIPLHFYLFAMVLDMFESLFRHMAGMHVKQSL